MSDVNAVSRSGNEYLPVAGEGREAAVPARGWPWLARKLVGRLFEHLHVGRLTIVSPSGEAWSSGPRSPGPDAVMVLRRWRTLRRLILGGDVAFGDAYVDGDWTSPDVAALVELAAANNEGFRQTVTGFRMARMVNRLAHALRPNTRRGSSRNIVAHYDLGNSFYERWLDPSMLYSSALFRNGHETLAQAQDVKLDRLVEALDLRGGEHVLEIGCGWGAMAERLARLGCRVTGLTISPAQLAFAERRIARAGLADRVDLRLQDYRDVGGRFDRIVSVEMIEAVGQRYWPAYFATLRDRLAPGGSAAIQAITIADDRFALYATAPDFIQRYVFLGGMLPSPSILAGQGRAAGLSLETVELFGASYARTLREWRHRFDRAWEAGIGSGFDERFRRLWDYYLAYCEGGFRAGATDVGIYRLRPVAP